MSAEHPNEQPEGKVISLVERRNREVARLLQDLQKEVKITKEGVVKEYEDLKLLVNLPVIENPYIADNVVDLNQVRENKKLREQQSGWVTDRKEIKDKMRDLIEKIKMAMIFLNDSKLRPVLLASHVLSESEVNFNFPGEEYHRFTDADLAKNPITATLKLYIPDFIDYLTSTEFGIDRLIGILKISNLDSQELKNALMDVHFQLQNGLKYAEYFLQMFDKNNPKQ